MTELPRPASIEEYATPDVDAVAAIQTGRRPVVVRGLGADWPAVAAARQSDEALVDYLRLFVHEQPVAAIVGEPEIGGRFFYTDDLLGLNFKRVRSPLKPFLNRLLRDRGEPRPLAMAVQSEQIPHLLPGFERQNRLDLLDLLDLLDPVIPRAWIGNRIRVAPHYDLMENVGVVVTGRRRFTLFPPDQIANLYPGPLELTPAGTPISLVDIEDPDLDRFPRYARAAESAQQAVLEPGDAIYIPYHWWHAVDSLAPFNLFVNYWWNDGPKNAGSPYDALMFALYALKPMPADQREVWREVLDYYVFERHGDPGAHLPPRARGVLSKGSGTLLARLRETLRQTLAKL